MSGRCEPDERMDDIRERIIGLGASGQRKSYYPQLQERIDELERANQALAQSEEKYRTLVENVDVGIFRTAAEGAAIVQANPALAKMLGYDSAKELMRVSAFDLYHDIRDRPVLLARLSRHEEVKYQKVKVRRRDGTYIPASLTLTAVRNARGTIEWIDGVLVDMTEQEVAQRRTEGDRARLQAIFDTLPVGIIIIDSASRSVDANERWLQIWGEEAAPKEADRMDRYVGWHPGSTDRLKGEEWPIARALRGESIINEEIDMKRSDGAQGTLLASAVPILDRGGEIIGAVSTIIDITARRRLERDLDEARSRAELYIDLLTHDISNYNTAAMGYLQLAEERFHLDDKDRRLITKPLAELRNSTELVANIWDLQLVESGREKTGPVNVRRMLGQVIEDHSSVPGRDVNIRQRGDCDCRVMASELLSVVFSNIISNAINHSAGAVNIEVAMSADVRGGADMVRVDIADDGPGIPDERKEAIFDRSLMGLTKPVSRGLGLYLVKRLVENYGGEVWVEDRIPGDHTEGARFVVELPLYSEGMGNERSE